MFGKCTIHWSYGNLLSVPNFETARHVQEETLFGLGLRTTNKNTIEEEYKSTSLPQLLTLLYLQGHCLQMLGQIPHKSLQVWIHIMNQHMHVPHCTVQGLTNSFNICPYHLKYGGSRFNLTSKPPSTSNERTAKSWALKTTFWRACWRIYEQPWDPQPSLLRVITHILVVKTFIFHGFGVQGNPKKHTHIETKPQAWRGVFDGFCDTSWRHGNYLKGPQIMFFPSNFQPNDGCFFHEHSKSPTKRSKYVKESKPSHVAPHPHSSKNTPSFHP